MFKRPAKTSKDSGEPPSRKSRFPARNKQNVTVWASLFLGSSTPYATFEMSFETGHGLTVMRIAESVKLKLGDVLQNVSASDLHVFSGRNHVRLLEKDHVWNIESHGGDSEDKALLVKVSMPAVMPNQGMSAEIRELREGLEREAKERREGLGRVDKGLERVGKELRAERKERHKDSRELRGLITDLKDRLLVRSISISEVKEDDFDEILSNLGVNLNAAQWDSTPNDTQDVGTQGFNWLPSAENSQENREAYMTHLKTFPWPEGYAITDVAFTSILSCKLAGVKLKGSIDVVLASTDNVRENTVKNNIVLGIELKKADKSKAKLTDPNQVIVQHLCASFLNPDTGVLTLLTDLDTRWTFFWFGGNHIICKVSASENLAKFLLKNMFNPEVKDQCPVGFHSRLSWNKCFPGHQRNAVGRNIVGHDADRDDENNSRSSDPRNSSTDDDGDAKEDGPDSSKGNAVGGTEAVNFGRGGRSVLYRDKWNGRDVGNELDLVDFFDEEERSWMFLNAIVRSNFPCFSTSIVPEDGDNGGLLYRSLVHHNAMLDE